MTPQQTLSPLASPERHRELLRHAAEVALLLGLFAIMALCLMAGPHLTALLVP